MLHVALDNPGEMSYHLPPGQPRTESLERSSVNRGGFSLTVLSHKKPEQVRVDGGFNQRCDHNPLNEKDWERMWTGSRGTTEVPLMLHRFGDGPDRCLPLSGTNRTDNA